MVNKTEHLHFSKWLKSSWITHVRDYYLGHRTIVSNIGTTPAVIDTPEPIKSLAPRTSTILKDIKIKSADSLVLFEIPDETNIGGCVLEEGWHQLSALAPGYPKDTPLYKSPQFNVGKAKFDPFHATGVTDHPHSNKAREHQVKVNVWWCPAKTDCGIHNHSTEPEMFEVHTQVYGTGRMQKFHNEDFSSLYEDVILTPGNTHIPFCGARDDGKYRYPWHQYYGDTDCIWMAIEYHQL